MFNISHRTDHAVRPLFLAAFTLLTVSMAAGQTPTTGNPPATAPAEWTARTSQELDELVSPIALYPDDLIAIILPAATYPLQIVQASRYLEERDANAALEPDPEWDDSVVALLNYPEALALLNDDLDWTWELGEAVVYQQGDVLGAIQSFRDRAQAAGNLSTDDRQVVAIEDDGAITIAPADPEVIYVPYYDPASVVVRQHVPVYHYYPYAYPLYYYPYPSGYMFGTGFFWGVSSAFLVSWHDHYLHVRHHSHYGHPYYGYDYYAPWYARTNVYVNVSYYGNHHYWRPGYRHGGRPQHHAGYATRYDGNDRRMRTTRVSDWRGDSAVGYARDRGLGHRVVDDAAVRRAGRSGDGDSNRSRPGNIASGAGPGRVVDAGARRSRNTGIRPPAEANGATRRVIDDGELRRLRGGATAGSDIRANADTPRERSLGDAYRRPRAADGRVTRDVDARSTGMRLARAHGAAAESRTTRSFDTPARSSRGLPNRSGLATQTRASPSSFSRIAPAPRAQAPMPRPAQGREQPISWPGAGSAHPSPSLVEHGVPSRGAFHAQPGTRPMLHDAGAGLNGGRLEFAGRGQSRR